MRWVTKPATLTFVVIGVALSACELSDQDLAAEHSATVSGFCVDCHNDLERTAELTLESLDLSNVAAQAEVWEKVVRKLRTGMMPPADQLQPSAGDRNALASWLETSLDEAAAANPNPGRTETLRRLNRTEYQNAIRDLLALDIDATALLPNDESGYGFDNVNVGDLSPALLDRYITAAQKISRLAVGSTETSLQSDVIRVPVDATQEEHVAGLPIGTRGGLTTSYIFAQDGEYDIQILLARNRNGNIGGLRGETVHTLQLLLDRTPVATFTVERPEGGDDTLADSQLKIRVPVTAGPHEVGATFLKNASSLLDTERQPLQSHFNEQRHPRLTPADLPGKHHRPVRGAGCRRHAEPPPALRLHAGSARREQAEEACAEEILSTLMRRAYRRPVSAADVDGPMVFYRGGDGLTGDFDAGIGSALTSVLVEPRVSVPRGARPGRGGVRRCLSHQRSRARLASLILSCGAASPTTSCSMRPSGGAQPAWRDSNGRPAECSPIRGRTIWQATLPDSGSCYAISSRSVRIRVCIPTSTTICVRRSDRRPSSSSTACCGKTAACSSCSARTTRF